MSRILAAQDNLTEARRNQMEALAVAEKIGAKGLVAQARLSLAETDLEEGRANDAEQIMSFAPKSTKSAPNSRFKKCPMN